MKIASSPASIRATAYSFPLLSKASQWTSTKTVNTATAFQTAWRLANARFEKRIRLLDRLFFQSVLALILLTRLRYPIRNIAQVYAAIVPPTANVPDGEIYAYSAS